MISQILQHLDALHVELSEIDPAQDCNAADTVADLALALRRLVADVSVDLPVAERPAETTRPVRNAA